MIVIDNKFNLKQQVYLVTDPDQKTRIITAIYLCADGTIYYELSCGLDQSKHYDFEISDQKAL